MSRSSSMILSAAHLLPSLLLAGALATGCAASHAVVPDRDTVVSGGLGIDSGGEPSHANVWWLYERARTYIANDTSAARVCGVPIPVPVRVLDDVSCLMLPLSDVPGLFQFFYPTDRADSEYYYDSLGNQTAQPCQGYSDPVMARRLSTSSDTRRTLQFFAVDTTTAPGYSILMGFLFKGYWSYCDSDTEDDAEWMAELDQGESFPTGCEGLMAYLFVYDRAGNLVWETNEEGQCQP